MVWADSLPFWKTTHFVVSYCIIINPHWRESNRRCCYRLRFSDFVGVLSIPFNIDVISLLSGLLGDLDLASGRHTSAWECYVSIDLRHTLYEKVTTDCQAKMFKQMSVGDTQTGASNPGFILKRYSVSNFWSRNVLKACHKDNIKTIRSLILHKNRKKMQTNTYNIACRHQRQLLHLTGWITVGHIQQKVVLTRMTSKI